MIRSPIRSGYVAVTTGYLPAGIAFGALASSLKVPYYFTAAVPEILCIIMHLFLAVISILNNHMIYDLSVHRYM